MIVLQVHFNEVVIGDVHDKPALALTPSGASPKTCRGTFYGAVVSVFFDDS